MRLKHTLNLALAVTCLSIVPMPSAIAKAGGVGSGGGDAIVCKQGNDEKVYLADTFAILKKLHANSRDLDVYKNYYQQDFVWHGAFYTAYTKENPVLARKAVLTLRELNFVESGELPELEDDNIGELPAGCHKKQLAIQDLKTKTVYYNSALYRKLSTFEKSILRLHEAFIYLELVRAGNSSKIRERIARIATSSEFLAEVKKYDHFFGSGSGYGVGARVARVRVNKALIEGARVFINFEGARCLIVISDTHVSVQYHSFSRSFYRRIESVQSMGSESKSYKMHPFWGGGYYDVLVGSNGFASLRSHHADGSLGGPDWFYDSYQDCRRTLNEIPMSRLNLE